MYKSVKIPLVRIYIKFLLLQMQMQMQISIQDCGEPAFFLELAALAKDDIRGLLSIDEEACLDA